MSSRVDPHQHYDSRSFEGSLRSPAPGKRVVGGRLVGTPTKASSSSRIVSRSGTVEQGLRKSPAKAVPQRQHPVQTTQAVRYGNSPQRGRGGVNTTNNGGGDYTPRQHRAQGGGAHFERQQRQRQVAQDEVSYLTDIQQSSLVYHEDDRHSGPGGANGFYPAGSSLSFEQDEEEDDLEEENDVVVSSGRVRGGERMNQHQRAPPPSQPLSSEEAKLDAALGLLKELALQRTRKDGGLDRSRSLQADISMEDVRRVQIAGPPISMQNHHHVPPQRYQQVQARLSPTPRQEEQQHTSTQQQQQQQRTSPQVISVQESPQSVQQEPQPAVVAPPIKKVNLNLQPSSQVSSQNGTAQAAQGPAPAIDAPVPVPTPAPTAPITTSVAAPSPQGNMNPNILIRRLEQLQERRKTLEQRLTFVQSRAERLELEESSKKEGEGDPDNLSAPSSEVEDRMMKNRLRAVVLGMQRELEVLRCREQHFLDARMVLAQRFPQLE